MKIPPENIINFSKILYKQNEFVKKLCIDYTKIKPRARKNNEKAIKKLIRKS